MRKRIYTKEMLADLGNMTDRDFGKKWGIDRVVVVRNRNQMGIKPFLPQSNVKRKFIDGVECKWCSREGGHWALLSEFDPCKSRAGGYRGFCRKHDRQYAREIYYSTNQIENSRAWKKTDNGRKYLRNTWRKKVAKRKEIFVKWDKEDEEKAYDVFGGRCAYCGIQTPFLEVEFDHFVPVANGGKTEPKNMVPCCKRCNHGSGGKFMKETFEWLESKYGEARAIWIYRDIQRKIKEITK